MAEDIVQVKTADQLQREQVGEGIWIPEEWDRFSFMSLVSLLVRRYKQIIAGSMSLAIIGVLLALFGGYTARASFVSSAPDLQGSQLASLAAQFGVSGLNLGANSSLGSPAFYVDLVQSKDLLAAVAQTQYRFATDDESKDSIVATYVDLSGASGAPPQRLLEAVEKLGDHLKVSEDAESGVVSVETRAKWPELAEKVNRRILTLVDSFNLYNLRSQAGAERQFLEGRLGEARAELTAAEHDLEMFLDRNRTYQSSARLVFEQGRLQRLVDQRHQVHTALTQAYEQARLSEVRNTPVITVIDKPEGSSKVRWKVFPLAALGFVFGGVLGVGLAFLSEYLDERRRAKPEEFAELERQLRTAFPVFLRLPRRKRARGRE